jgi:hypothetical protein
MKVPKIIFTTEDEVSSSKDIESKPIIKYEEKNFWDRMLDMLPTPEQEIENMEKDEIKLNEMIQETKEALEKIDKALISEKIEDYDVENLNSLKLRYTSLLEEFESELQCIKIQHKSMNSILDEDYNSENDEFEKNIPELIANSMLSTKKKMEDVNDVVKTIEKISKKNRIEECIHCERIIKDEQGRKSSILHIHLHDKIIEDFKKYKPVICLDCFEIFKMSKSEKFDYNVKVSEIDSETVCKKGSKIYSKELYEEIPEFVEKYKKYINLEKEEFLNNIKREDKKDIFSFLKY